VSDRRDTLKRRDRADIDANCLCAGDEAPITGSPLSVCLPVLVP
jgi:hypothetical protein